MTEEDTKTEDSASRNPEADACDALALESMALAISSRHDQDDDVDEAKRRRVVQAMATLCDELGLGHIADRLATEAASSFGLGTGETAP